MSLVINANKNEGNTFSNDVLSGYPDFGSILLKPICREKITDFNNDSLTGGIQTKNITPETFGKSAYSVNGTVVNFVSNILEKNRIYGEPLGTVNTTDYIDFLGYGGAFIAGGSAYPNYSRYFNNLSRNVKLRIGSIDNFRGGEVVGKYIASNVYFYHNMNGGGSNVNTAAESATIIIKIKFKPGLLKPNGSIQYIGEVVVVNNNLTFSNEVIGNRYFSNKNNFVEGNFLGVVAGYGDKVIVDIDFNFSASRVPKNTSGALSIQNWCGIGFGSNGSREQNVTEDNMNFTVRMAPRPIQISIE